MALKNLKIENARIIFRNFRGEAGVYNNAGNRNFCLVLDPDTALTLNNDGWNVKWPKVEDRDPYLPVSVRYGVSPTLDPKIFVRNSPNDQFVSYTENMVGNLDNAEIETIDLVVRPREWESRDGKTGVKAYLKSMYVTLMQDEFYGKYFPTDPAEYEAPFELADAQD